MEIILQNLQRSAKTIITTFLLLEAVFRYSQVTVTGPTCVMAGTSYSYQVIGSWTSSSNMQICSKHGTISGTFDSCTNNGLPLAMISIVWDSVPGPGQLVVSSSSGNASFNVNIITPLNPGSIMQSIKTQSIAYNKIASQIDCSVPTGGNCSPSYSFQWEQSDNNLVWTPIPGATASSLKNTAYLKQSIYVRRKVIEIHSGTIAYSNYAIVFVAPDLTGHN